MSTNEIMEFSLDLREIPFRVKNAEGAAEDYVVREPMEDAMAAYRKLQYHVAKLNPNINSQKPTDAELDSGIDAAINAPNVLGRMCCWKKNGGVFERISKETYDTWPSRLRKWVAEQAQVMSGSDDEETLDSLKKRREEIEKAIAARESGELEEQEGKSSTPKKDGSG